MRCIVLLFGIRLPLFPASAHMVAARRGEAASFSSLCLSSSDSLHRPPGALTVDPITSPWLFDLARKIPTHQRPKKNTMRCMVFFFGIRLPIFPPEAPTVRQGRTPCLTGSPVRFIVHRTRSQSIPSPTLGCLTWPGKYLLIKYLRKTPVQHRRF